MKVALVTGPNRGIGYQITKNILSIADFGLVILAGRSERAVREAVGQMEAEAEATNYQGRVEYVPLDLSQPTSIPNTVSIVSKLLGETRKIDAFINNAGFAYSTDCKLSVGEQAATTIGINYTQSRALIEGLLPYMKPATGRIVQLGSRAGLLSQLSGNVEAQRLLKDATGDLTVEQLEKVILGDYLSATKKGDDAVKLGGWSGSTYCMSKVAINTYIRLLSRSEAVQKLGINVNVVCPGWCKTDMTQGEGNKTAAEGADTPTWLATSQDEAAVKANGLFFAERKPISYF